MAVKHVNLRAWRLNGCRFLNPDCWKSERRKKQLVEFLAKGDREEFAERKFDIVDGGHSSHCITVIMVPY
jgi:hypothetical protein